MTGVIVSHEQAYRGRQGLFCDAGGSIAQIREEQSETGTKRCAAVSQHKTVCVIPRVDHLTNFRRAAVVVLTSARNI